MLLGENTMELPFPPMPAVCTEPPALSASCPSPNKSPAGQQMRNHLRRGGFCIIMPPFQEDVSPNKQVAATCTIWDPSSSGLFCSPLLERWSSFAPSHTHTHTHTHPTPTVFSPLRLQLQCPFYREAPLPPLITIYE